MHSQWIPDSAARFRDDRWWVRLRFRTSGAVRVASSLPAMAGRGRGVAPRGWAAVVRQLPVVTRNAIIPRPRNRLIVSRITEVFHLLEP